MAPIPIQTSHVLATRYTVDSLTHTTRFLVDAVASGDSTGWSLHCESSADVGLSTAMTQWAAVLGPFLPTGSSAAGYTLYKVDGTALIPLYTGTWSLTPTANQVRKAGQTTIFFRDGLNHPAKIVIMEGYYVPPYHMTSLPVDAGPLQDIVATLNDNTAGHLGAFVKSRGDGFPDRFISVTGTLNRKIRRKRGLA